MKIAIYVYEGITALDAIGPYESLSRLPELELLFVGKSKGLVRTGNNMLGIYADYDTQSVAEADILIIPGGSTQSIQNMVADVQLSMEYDPKPPFKLGSAEVAATPARVQLIDDLNIP